MKKFYTMLGAAVIAMSAAGASLADFQVNRTMTPQANPAKRMIVATPVENISAEHKASNKLNAPAKATELITEANGETKYYQRAGGTFFVNTYLYEDTQEGIMEVVYGENNEVFIKNPVNFFATQTYVKGTLEGNTITVALPQTLYEWTSYGYGAELAWGNIERNEEGTVASSSACTYDTETTEAVFTINGNTMTLEGSDENHILGAFYDDDQSWTGRGDYESVLTEIDINQGLVFPPVGDDYWYSGKCSSERMKKTVKVFKSGSDIYFQGIHCGSVDNDQEVLPEAWVKGTIEGTTVTIPTGQYLGYAEGYLMYFVGNDGNNAAGDIILEYDEDADLYTFQNAYYLNAKKDEIYYMYNFEAGNIIGKDEPQLPTPLVAPENLETKQYLFTSSSVTFGQDEETGLYYQNEGTPVSIYVNVGFDGNDVWMQGLCQDLPEAWVKGTMENNVVTFPMEQYFGLETVSFWGYVWEYDHFFTGMKFNDLSSFDYALQDITMNYDPETGIFTAPDYILDNGDQGRMYYIYCYTDVVIKPVVEKAATPADPEITAYTFYDNYGYGRVNCTVPTVDVDGDPMVAEKLYYKFYGDIEREIAELVFDPEDYYYVEEAMVEIPYLFTENYDIYEGGATVYLNQPEIPELNKIGIQSVYYGGVEMENAPAKAEGNTSNIFWYEIKPYNDNVAVNSITAGKTVKSVRYYNVAGQMSSKPFDGMNIVVSTYTDGTTSTVKVVK